MVRFFMRGLNVGESYHFQCLEKIVPMQPAMLVIHATAKSGINLGPKVIASIGANRDAVERDLLRIGRKHHAARIGERHGLFGDDMNPKKHRRSASRNEVDELQRVCEMVEYAGCDDEIVCLVGVFQPFDEVSEPEAERVNPMISLATRQRMNAS